MVGRRTAACLAVAGALARAVAAAEQAPAPAVHAATPADTAVVAERPQTLEDLMRVMAETPGVVADFTETKRLAILEAPLQTRGRLYFIPPDRMARHTNAPGKSSLIIDGDRLRFEDEAGNDDIDLAANPVARVFVENFIVLFNGDLAELRRRYEPTFKVDGERWSLTLVPKAAPLARLIESIEMRGDAAGMRSMTLREEGGDTTETVFENLDTRHRFSEREIADYFATATP